MFSYLPARFKSHKIRWKINNYLADMTYIVKFAFICQVCIFQILLINMSPKIIYIQFHTIQEIITATLKVMKG